MVITYRGSNMTSYVVTRQQPRRGTFPSQGPDVYVALVQVPEGVSFDPNRTPLQVSRLRSRGIEVTRIGEGYRKHKGPKSSLGQALRRAKELARRLSWVVTYSTPLPGVTVDLCDHCVEAGRTLGYALGQVQHGLHDGSCEACQRVWSTATHNW
jgi:hypothetical protein